MVRILLPYPTEPPAFVAGDVEMLRGLGHEVTVQRWTGDAGAVRSAMRGQDAGLGWFLSDHTAVLAAVCRLARKPCLAVAGGSDVIPWGDPWWTLIGQRPTVKLRAIRRAAANLPGEVLAVSPHTQRWARMLRLGRRVHLVPNAVAVPPGSGRRDGVLYVHSDVGVHKRPALVAEAARRLEPHGVEVHVAGHPLPAHVGNVVNHGWLPRPAYERLLGRVAVVLCPSLGESHGIVATEGVMAGAQVIATDHEGHRWGTAGQATRLDPALGVDAWVSATLDHLASPRPRADKALRERFDPARRRQAMATLLGGRL